MNDWEKAYEKGFEISSTNHSKIIDLIPEDKKKNSFILDLGCGNGRNSIYFAEKGNKVDCIDVVDLISKKIKNKKNIWFQKKSVEKFEYPLNKYDVVLMTRLIQYISKKNLENLFKKIKKSMKKEGVLVISYTKSGGIFNQDYSIKTYSYSVSEIIKSLKRNNLEINILRRGSKKTEYVPYKESAEIYEIIAKNK